MSGFFDAHLRLTHAYLKLIEFEVRFTRSLFELIWGFLGLVWDHFGVQEVAKRLWDQFWEDLGTHLGPMLGPFWDNFSKIWVDFFSLLFPMLPDMHFVRFGDHFWDPFWMIFGTFSDSLDFMKIVFPLQWEHCF